MSPFWIIKADSPGILTLGSEVVMGTFSSGGFDSFSTGRIVSFSTGIMVSSSTGEFVFFSTGAFVVSFSDGGSTVGSTISVSFKKIKNLYLKIYIIF